MYFRIITLMFVSFFPINQMVGQCDSERVLNDLENYRKSILEDKIEYVQYIKYTLRKLDSCGVKKKDIPELLSCTNFAFLSKKSTPNDIRKGLAILYKFNRIDLLTDDDIVVMEICKNLLELISETILQADYPFYIDSTSHIRKELCFYDFHNHEKIGEIGAGEGFFSFMSSDIYPQATFYLNEISSNSLDAIQRRINEIKLIRPDVNLNIQKGSTKSTNLEGKNLDKIFMRQTYHHFDKKKQMLKSIHKSLKPGGYLFIHEVLKDVNPKKHHLCENGTTRKKIVKKVTKYNFKYVDQITDDNLIVLKFQRD